MTELTDNGLVIVPRAELEKLDKARKQLWAMSDNYKFDAVRLYDMQKITAVMWGLANRNWPKVESDQ